ncbi:MAG: hypothetical protein ABSG98_06050 [Anaerolineales bacterium]|jgi:peptidoglycan hydrolase CwlO-like protein
MALNGQTGPVNKQIPALLAAMAISLTVGLVMAAIGLSAISNASSVPLKSAPTSNSGGSGDQVMIQQMQAEISQYQAREKQYQAELQQAAQQLNQAKTQAQQDQSLINALQDAGVIQVMQNGQVFVPSGLVGNFSSGGG